MAFSVAARAAALAARMVRGGARFAKPAYKAYRTSRALQGYAKKRMLTPTDTPNGRKRYRSAKVLEYQTGTTEGELLGGGVGGVARYKRKWISAPRRKRYWKKWTNLGRKYYWVGEWQQLLGDPPHASTGNDKSWLVFMHKIYDRSEEIMKTVQLPQVAMTGSDQIRQKILVTHTSMEIRIVNPFSWAMKYKIWMGYSDQSQIDMYTNLTSIQPDGNTWNRYEQIAMSKTYKTGFATVPAGNTKSLRMSIPTRKTIKITNMDKQQTYNSQNVYFIMMAYPEMQSAKLTTPVGNKNFAIGKPDLSQLQHGFAYLEKVHYVVPSQFNVNPQQLVPRLNDNFIVLKPDVDASEKQEPVDY